MFNSGLRFDVMNILKACGGLFVGQKDVRHTPYIESAAAVGALFYGLIRVSHSICNRMPSNC